MLTKVMSEGSSDLTFFCQDLGNFVLAAHFFFLGDHIDFCGLNQKEGKGSFS